MQTVTPELLKELAQAPWNDASSLEDDHKLERADFPSQPGLAFIRKKQKPDQMYVAEVPGASEWHCVKCAAIVQAAEVAHPIHDGPFPCSGGGRCSYETVPYCPVCEEKPVFHGSIITRAASW